MKEDGVALFGKILGNLAASLILFGLLYQGGANLWLCTAGAYVLWLLNQKGITH
jgi:hypothetical protein